MKLEDTEQYINAIFLKESRQRFLCTILLNEEEVECYVSSSSKISKYLNLHNKPVLISKNKASNLRTMYTLEAIQAETEEYIYLNFNKCNYLYKKHLIIKGVPEQDIQREQKVTDTLKVDFYIKTHGYFEIKSLLSSTAEIEFPDISSDRLHTQILEYIKLLNGGAPVTFVFLSMSKNLANFSWNIAKTDIKELFALATELGMVTEAYSVEFVRGEFLLRENLKLRNQIVQSYFAIN
ncbi:DNA/RNA nuclease SfsA [Chryseobacterium sp.]|uniref:DNA/RNA nuclease SfsA n=1 Tax=Chryseobacterium sp. TaxID=1871047 RepID=UPI002FC7FFC5